MRKTLRAKRKVKNTNIQQCAKDKVAKATKCLQKKKTFLKHFTYFVLFNKVRNLISLLFFCKFFLIYKSYFQLSKNENLKIVWVRLIKRTELPKRVHVCSDHFQESCFDQSWALQNRLFYNGRPVKRKLLSGSVPSIFLHKEPPKKNYASKKRMEQRQKSFFIIIFLN